MRVGSLSTFVRAPTLTPTPLPEGEVLKSSVCATALTGAAGDFASLLPPGEGGAERRMRAGSLSTFVRAPTLTPTPLPEGEGLKSFGFATTPRHAIRIPFALSVGAKRRSRRVRDVSTSLATQATLNANGCSRSTRQGQSQHNPESAQPRLSATPAPRSSCRRR